MTKIFLCYRRVDADGETGRLFQGLREHFGKANVFMDVTGVHAGADFRAAAAHAVESCDVFLAVIGDDWLTVKNPDGSRRLDNPEDLVRVEIATALRKNKVVVPVLVENAQMPGAKELPQELEALAGRNAVEVRHTHWDRDLAELIEKLGRRPPRPWVLAAAMVGVALVAILLATAVFSRKSLATTDQCRKVCALVADFYGPDTARYRVTERVLAKLDSATPGDAIEIVPLGRAIGEREGSRVAREEGQRRNAKMVIWGWYTATGVSASVSANFELLESPKYMPTFGPLKQTNLQNPMVAELDWTTPATKLETYSLQDDLSSQLTFLTLFSVGMLRYSADDWVPAIQQLSAALDHVPALDSGRLASVIHYKRGFSYLAQGDSARAMADYNRAIALRPEYVDAWIGRGLLQFHRGHPAEALADYDQVLKLDSANALAYNNRAGVHVSNQEFGRAIEDFSRAIRLKPDDPAMYQHRAWAYHASGDYDRAIADYGRALALKPDETVHYSEGSFDAALALYQRGASQYAKGDYERAIADYGLAIKLKSDFSLAYHDRGLAHRAKGDSRRAILDFAQAIKLNPADFSAYNNRGLAYSERGELDRAIADFDRAIQLRSNEAAVYNNRGNAYKKKDFQRAIADFGRALAIDSNYALAYHNRGLAYWERGDVDRAIAEYNQAIRLAPEDPLPYNDRGLAFARKGAYDRAIADYDKALQLKPDYALAIGNRGVALRAKSAQPVSP